MQQAWLGFVFIQKQLVEHEPIRLLSLAPQHHQNNDLELVERDMGVAYSQRALNDDFTLDWIDYLGGFQKLDKSECRGAERVQFLRYIDSGAKRKSRLLRVLH